MRTRSLAAALLLSLAGCGRTAGPDADAEPALAPRFVRSFGAWSGGSLDGPVGVALGPDGAVFVSDSGHARIVVYGPEGAFLRTFGGPQHLGRPMHLSFGPTGDLQVADLLRDRVVVYSPEGEWVRDLPVPGVDGVAGVAVDSSGRRFVADFYGDTIRVLAPDGSSLPPWGTTGSDAPGQLDHPTDVVAVGDALWVADAYNNRLQRFVDGRVDRVISQGSPQGFPGFNVAVAVAASDRLLAAVDSFGGRVRLLSLDGEPLGEFGEPGSGPGQLDHPQDVALRGSRAYVVDHGADRIQLWSLAPPTPEKSR